MIYNGKNLKLIKDGQVIDTFDTFELNVDKNEIALNPIITISKFNSKYIEDYGDFSLSFDKIETTDGIVSSGGENDTAYFIESTMTDNIPLSIIVCNGIK